MKTCASLFVLSFVLLPITPNAAWAAPPGGALVDDAAADRAAIDALLQEAAREGEVRVEQHADSSWLLKRALRQGFAMTPAPARAVREALRSSGQPVTPAWLGALERARLGEALCLHAAVVAKQEVAQAFDIPMSDHPLVDTYVQYFTGRGRWFFAKWLARADRYLPIMQPILAAKGLPQDLVYVAMVESGFSSRALSTASAAGYWQFIAPTASSFGMDMNVWVDERRDFVRATEAAAAYMTRLRREFGDWHLAWAGYNAGSGRIRRALDRFGARDYWSLVDNPKSLPQETRHYVAKILAAAIVAKNREAYGFTELEVLPVLEFEQVEVEDATDLKLVARHLRRDLEELRSLNPALLQDVTPPGRSWTLRVPRGEAEKTRDWLASVAPEQRLTYRQHQVAKGDTLWQIAERFGSSIEALKEFNDIGNPRALRLGQTLIIPSLRKGPQPRGTASVVSRPRARPAGSAKATTASKPATTARPTVTTRATSAVQPVLASSPQGRHHVVGMGETLWSISRRYGVSVQDLKRRNGLADNTIAVGAKLQVF